MKVSNTLNVGKIMRLNSGRYNVSPTAVFEMKDRIEMFLERNMPYIVKRTESHERKTVNDDDIVEFFSFIGNDIDG